MPDAAPLANPAATTDFVSAAGAASNTPSRYVSTSGHASARWSGVIQDFHAQLRFAARADALGFRALWVRDVPLNSAEYPDPVGHLDPWVLLGALASQTERIALISGAIVLTLRHPLHARTFDFWREPMWGARVPDFV